MTNLSSSTDHQTDETQSGLVSRSLAWSKRNWPKLLGVVIWVVLLAAYWLYTGANDLSPLQTVQQLVDFLATSTLGVVFYLLLYSLRPVIFFPATLLTLVAGYLYGPIFGTLIVVVASNLSSMIAYFIGRFLGNGVVQDSSSKGILQKYTERMRHNSFETVLIMRFLFLPYDLVSYFSGFLRIDWRGFLFATFLGSIPGTISFVLFGASIEGDFTGELPSLNTTSLIIAVAMFVVSIGLSRWFKQRERKRNPSTSQSASS